MLARRTDPIVAVATAPGRGAVGIVRVSGHGLAPLVQALLGAVPPARTARYGPFPDGRGRPLDHGLALWFPAPHSFTGEDVLELQAHGGPVLLQLLVRRALELAAEVPAGQAAPRLAGLRLAGPGEFTERAYLNGKLDLAQAEAVADLIDATTEAAARSAGAALDGAFSRELAPLRDGLVDLRVLVESTLDFPEEELDFLERADAAGRLAALSATLDAVRRRARQGALLRDGMQVVLAGQPNVGKSSLLNALAGAELAIVTPVPGTTRDRIGQTVQVEGVPLHLVDTAGLRESADEVERIGIARSWQAIETADAVVFLHDLTRWDEPQYARDEADIARRLGLDAPLDARPRLLHVFNKADAAGPGDVERTGAGALRISARTGDGLAALREALLAQVGWQAMPDGVFAARERHLQALQRTAEHLACAVEHLGAPQPALDLLAEELRRAHEALGEITGAVDADTLLGEIFARFCIGK